MSIQKKRHKELTFLKKVTIYLHKKYPKSEARSKNQLGKTNKQTTTIATTSTTKTKTSKNKQKTATTKK